MKTSKQLCGSVLNAFRSNNWMYNEGLFNDLEYLADRLDCDRHPSAWRVKIAYEVLDEAVTLLNEGEDLGWAKVELCKRLLRKTSRTLR